MTRLVRIIVWLIAVSVTIFMAYAWAVGMFRSFPITLFWIVGVTYLTWWALRGPIDPPRPYSDKWERRARAKVDAQETPRP